MDRVDLIAQMIQVFAAARGDGLDAAAAFSRVLDAIEPEIRKDVTMQLLNQVVATAVAAVGAGT